MLELHRVANEEHRGVVAHQVVITLTGVELEREAARIAPGVGTALFARHGGEASQHVGLGAGLENGGLGVGTDVLRHLEMAEGARAFRVGLALGNMLAVEVGHLFDQVVILQDDGAIRADRQ